MLVEVLISIFGLLIGRRIFQQLDANRIFETKLSEQYWKLFILIQIFIFSFRFEAKIVSWCLQVAVLFLPAALIWGQEIVRRRKFEQNLIPLLDFICLQMRSGRGIKDAIQIASGSFPEIQYQIAEISSVLHFDAHNGQISGDQLVSNAALEIAEVAKSPFKSVERLKAFRNFLKTEQDFRRKIFQATMQVRLQAAVLSFLYFALLLYILYQHGFEKIKQYVAASLFLYMLGLVFLILLPRRARWKT